MTADRESAGLRRFPRLHPTRVTAIVASIPRAALEINATCGCRDAGMVTMPSLFSCVVDIALINAPPRLTAGAINAFCASTHLLIPTVYDVLSAEAVGTFQRRRTLLTWRISPVSIQIASRSTDRIDAARKDIAKAFVRRDGSPRGAMCPARKGYGQVPSRIGKSWWSYCHHEDFKMRAATMALWLVIIFPLQSLAESTPVFTETECYWRYLRARLDRCVEAARGDTASMHRLGRMILYAEGGVTPDGEALWRDDFTAARLLRQSAEGGFAAAAADLGEMYERGRGVLRDLAQAEHWYGSASDARNVLGSFRQARLLAAKDMQQARRQIDRMHAIAEPLARAGDLDALYVTGAAALLDGELRSYVLLDSASSLERLRQATDQGHVPASAVLGAALVKGYPEKLRNPSDGVRLLEWAALRHDAEACQTLAEYYNDNHKARKAAGDPRMLQLWTCAAEQGDALAAYRLGRHYYNYDLAKSRGWYRIAVDLGDGESLYMLARMLITGEGGPRDEAAALAVVREMLGNSGTQAPHLANIATDIARHPQSSAQAFQLVLEPLQAWFDQQPSDLWVNPLAHLHLRLGNAAMAEALARSVLDKHTGREYGSTSELRVLLARSLAAQVRKDSAREELNRALPAAQGLPLEREIQYYLAELDRT